MEKLKEKKIFMTTGRAGKKQRNKSIIHSSAQPLGNSSADSFEDKHVLTKNATLRLLDIDPREEKTYISTKTYTLSFIAASFLIAKN